MAAVKIWRIAPALIAALCCLPGQVMAQDEPLAPVTQSPAQPFVWAEQDWGTPPSIRVYAGAANTLDGHPIRAWYADIDYSDTGLVARPFLSQAPDGKERVSAFAQRIGAYVAINGGYFDMTGQPVRTFSLVVSNGRLDSKNIAKVTRRNGIYDVTRSAFGIRADRSFDIAWIAHFGDAIYAFPQPTPNTLTTLAPPPTPNYPPGGALWPNITDAIGGGPTLIHAGQPQITYEAEAFFGSGFESDVPYPRSAIGYTANHHLILFAVDGKRPDYSRGLTLPELAQELLRLGCMAAMNLDGGGSTSLVVSGVMLNQPSDGVERRVTSALTIMPSMEAR